MQWDKHSDASLAISASISLVFLPHTGHCWTRRWRHNVINVLNLSVCLFVRLLPNLSRINQFWYLWAGLEWSRNAVPVPFLTTGTPFRFRFEKTSVKNFFTGILDRELSCFALVITCGAQSYVVSFHFHIFVTYIILYIFVTYCYHFSVGK